MSFTSWDCPVGTDSIPAEGAASGPVLPKGNAAASLPGTTCSGSLEGCRGHPCAAGGTRGLSSVCPARSPPAGSELATSQHLGFAPESDVPRPKEGEHAMKARASWSVSLPEASWSSVAYERWMIKRNNTGLYVGKWTAHVLTLWSRREPNTVFFRAAGGTDLDALGDVKQR